VLQPLLAACSRPCCAAVRKTATTLDPRASPPVSEQVRYEGLRDGALNHLVHHRTQLTVYLRLNELPVPSLYGPSADEKAF
jgi:uncharacterized damage-inducible protein DinB